VVDSLQFLLMVDSALRRADLLALVLRRFPDAIAMTENSCDLRANWVEVWANEEADATRSDGPDGHRYYPWRVEATPMHGRVTRDEQVALARKLRDVFVDAGGRASIRADFEVRV
jgi:hypothetical protein